jgi:hypothetical protein
MVVRREWLARAPWIVLLAFLVGSNRWMTWAAGIRYTAANDVLVYQTIASAAPSLPTSRLGSAYTERFVIHYLLGTIAKAIGAPLPVVYWLAWGFFLALIAIVIHLILSSLRLSAISYWLCMAALLLSPFIFRLYALVPGMIQDVLFMLGLSIVLLGLTRVNGSLVCIGLMIAVLARQTALPAALPIALWTFLGAGWRDRPMIKRALWTAAVTLTPFLVYAVVTAIARPFTFSFEPQIPQDTILPLLIRLPDHALDLVVHVLRIASPLLVTSTLLITSCILLWWSRRTTVPFEFWTSLLIAASVIGQPLLISSSFPGFERNESRISALGLPALVVALAFALQRLEGASANAFPKWVLVLIFCLIGVASLHPIFSIVGFGSTGRFFVLEACASTALASLLVATHVSAASASRSSFDRVRSSKVEPW